MNRNCNLKACNYYKQVFYGFFFRCQLYILFRNFFFLNRFGERFKAPELSFFAGSYFSVFGQTTDRIPIDNINKNRLLKLYELSFSHCFCWKNVQ